MVVLIHNGQFFNLVFLKYLCSGDKVGLLMCCHEVILRHNVVNLLVEMALETQVAVGHDTHEMVIFVNHGNTANMIFGHHVESVLHCRTTANGDGIVDHTVLGTLHDSHLPSLLLDSHILMNNTNTALACNGNSHLRLGDSVHSRSDEGHVQRDVTREHGFQLYRSWQYLRISWD